MGKLGAGELNYSSDIDLIVLFDPEVREARRGRGAVGALRPADQEAGADPQRAYRGRLRLPHRPAASPRSRRDQHRDLDRGGAAVLREPRPELGARGADQGAADRRRHRRRRRLPRASSSPTSGGSISTTRRSPTSTRSSARSTIIAATRTIAVAGHNIKLGRGGIREIEFFVQTQQLIAGGRNPELRGRGTLEMLDALAKGELDRRGDARRSCRGLRRAPPHRALPPDDRRRADPHAARG